MRAPAMDDADMFNKVRELVDQEHALRASIGSGAVDLKGRSISDSSWSSIRWTNAGTSYAAGSPPRGRSGDQPSKGVPRCHMRGD